ncbi:trypco2 family protein [Streptomyces sp. NBC_01198]|uniref:trypco2 family protein n=1 Tax=Streptomyces sp. NBC_01198 TaxID=2903769 RepID=UPI002E154AAE|nr:hypothetical protein OG702_06940 [Streptomyces sp. NBC_01198]
MIELSVLIGQLRAELTRAMVEGQGSELRFALGEVELELMLAVERDAGVNGRVRFWVAEGGGEAKVADSATQRIRLTLEPQLVADNAEGPPTRLVISGTEEDGER